LELLDDRRMIGHIAGVLKDRVAQQHDMAQALDFTRPDSADEDTLNRIPWFAADRMLWEVLDLRSQNHGNYH
jgi:hypothetical protein